MFKCCLIKELFVFIVYEDDQTKEREFSFFSFLLVDKKNNRRPEQKNTPFLLIIGAWTILGGDGERLQGSKEQSQPNEMIGSGEWQQTGTSFEVGTPRVKYIPAHVLDSPAIELVHVNSHRSRGIRCFLMSGAISSIYPLHRCRHLG
jgi:hypothetical protein